MKKIIPFILLILCVNNIHSQESINLILQYYGYKDNPYKEVFIANNLSTDATQEEIENISNYYDSNEKEILAKYDYECHAFYLKALEKVREKNRANMAVGANVVMEAVAQGVSTYNQQKAIEEQQKAEKEAQWHSEQQVRVAQNKQKYAEFQAMTNNKVHTSNYQSRSTTTTLQSNYNDLLTSDASWNTQVQMWVQQYGVEKTREIVKQKRANDYQQSVQTNNNYSQNQQSNERIISAVTSNRQQINIKVRGDVIIAYSNGVDQIGKQSWVSVLPNVGISKTGAGSLYNSGNLSKEFSYTASLNGTQIYFNM